MADKESDGRRSVRSLSGLRRDSEVMFVPKYDANASNRGKLDGLFENDSGDEENRSYKTFQTSSSGRGTVGKRAGSISGIGISRSISQPDYMHEVRCKTCSNIFKKMLENNIDFSPYYKQLRTKKSQQFVVCQWLK